MSEFTAPPTLQDILAAAERIAPLAQRTPVVTSRGLDDLCGARLYFKCENFQRTGSFKIRGACNAIFSLTDEAIRGGVVTHSSGNHASAVACAASFLGARSFIVVPRNTPLAKRETATGFGGEVHLCEPTLPARQAAVDVIQQRTGAAMVHPYDDPLVIAGQGTTALELMREIHELAAVVAPVSGGGLLSGTSIAATALKPGIEVFGAEPERADDAFRSFHSGKLEPLLSADTIADGLRANLCRRTFAIIKANVTDILTVSEEQIVNAMKLIWRYLKIVVEPSGAVPLAMILAHRERFAGRRVGLILTGGNLDLDKLPWQT
ncbi:MAG TPA: pyridoxal-phosphate dependent enzyme [Prosthecobacter sp.]|nr:pyridoxal-phosphate dependent enzyme [Prosthecobacter sp.]